jgi:hypothetical protein
MDDQLKIIFVFENLFESILADIITFASLICTLAINHYYLGDSTLVNIIICVSIFSMAFVRGSSKTKRMSPDQALDFLKEKLEDCL